MSQIFIFNDYETQQMFMEQLKEDGVPFVDICNCEGKCHLTGAATGNSYARRGSWTKKLKEIPRRWWNSSGERSE